MSVLHLEDLQGAMDQIKAMVVRGVALDDAIGAAASDWELNPALMRRKVAGSGWTEEGIRNTHEATKSIPIEQVVRHEIEERLRIMGRPITWTQEFEAYGDKWTATGNRFFGRVCAIRHSSAQWEWLPISAVTDPELRDLFQTWARR